MDTCHHMVQHQNRLKMSSREEEGKMKEWRRCAVKNMAVDWTNLFPHYSSPTRIPVWARVCERESNRGVRWSLLTDIVVIGKGSQDVSEPLTCPLALSTPLSPHIDHPTTRHWSGKPGTSALLRCTLRLSHSSVMLHVCVWWVDGRCACFHSCATVCVFNFMNGSASGWTCAYKGTLPFVMHTKDQGI